MTDLRLSAREVEDVLAGRQPDGRADLAALAEFAAVLHASSEVEPPPPMSAGLRAQINRGVSPEVTVRPRRHRPRHLQAVPEPPTGLVAYRRPLLSMAAAAALLVVLIVVTSRGDLRGEVHSAVSDVGSAIGFDLSDDGDGEDAAPAVAEQQPSTSTTTSTTTTTEPPPPPTTAAPPTTEVAPAPAPSAGEDVPWWLSPEVWQHWLGRWSPDGQRSDDGRSGDERWQSGDHRDGRGDTGGDGWDTGDGRTGTYGQGRSGEAETTVSPATSTTASPPSTSTSSTTAGSTTTTQ